MAIAEMPAVYRMAYHLATTGPAEAEDLVQETYLRAFKAEASFRLGTVGVKPWLLKILHNVFLTRIKRVRLEPVASDFAHDVPQESDGGGGLAAQSLADIDWEQVDGRLKRAIEELPETYRTVFLLSSVEGLKYREIGEVLGTPIGTVMSRLFRARTMLLGQLGDLGAEMGMDSEGKSARADETGR
jgi:RNA polymerase sigma-70 factor (ECF subfamily)